MKILKRILIAILILVVLLLVIAFMLPKEVKVDVTQDIDAPVDVVYNIVNDYETQPLWNPWVQADPTMKITYGDTIVGTGARYQWTSKNSGSGSQRITESVTNENIRMNVLFDGMGGGDADYAFAKKGNKTQLRWSFFTEIGVPMNLMNFFTKRQITNSLKQGLTNINDLAKARFINSEYGGYVVRPEIMDAKTYVVNRAEVNTENTYQYYVQNLPSLFSTLQDLDLKLEGKPSILYFNDVAGSGKRDMAAALPLGSDMAIDANKATTAQVQAGKVLVVKYFGDQQGILSAHRAIQQYMKDRKLLKRYPIIQEFVTDTSKEADPKKWMTRVVYPIAE